MITFDRDICTDFDEASSREWLETNGIGGFASGTISGANTRRYHGLLTAAIRPPLGRITMFSKFEETVVIHGKPYELSSNQYPQSIYPEGFKYIKRFRLDPFPIWTFEVDGIEIEKTVFMIHGRNSVCVKYAIKSPAARSRSRIGLEIKPLLSFVDYHALQHENAGIDLSYEAAEGIVSVHPCDALPSLFFNHNASEIEGTGFWYREFEYAIERERGFDYTEDLFQPFAMRFDLTVPAVVIASTDEHDVSGIADLETAELFRREELIAQSGFKDDFAMQLVLAADQFIVTRGGGQTIIAGYPWFSDWGRDTMISLPGLTPSTNRPEIARNILLEFSKHISQGMLPNRFPDAGDEAEYNTVDATLWYFEGIRSYAETTCDFDFIRDELYEGLADIIVWHLRGTRYNIHIDTDGLLYAGGSGVQLTWMDAKIGEHVITPRTGKAVEIQALWYNALKIMADLARRFGDNEDGSRYEAMADLAKISFNAVFWNDAEQCLYDVVENGTRDGSVRPNQIFAASLPFSMLDDERARKVVDKVQAELLTPVGLRSLSPKDPKYIPAYIGSPFERDSAYHQGTVWAWLIGAFIDAYRRAYPGQENKTAGFLAGFKSHIMAAGIGQISEIFDADAPHAPRGCQAQAWSVAEILRVLRATNS